MSNHFVDNPFTVVGDGPQRAPNRWPAAWLRRDPDAPTTSPEAVYRAAQRYVAAGLSVIPIAADGSKSPDWQRLPRHWDNPTQRSRPSWRVYQVRRPREAELRDWFEFAGEFGLAVIGGAVSGGTAGFGLEVIDFDTADLFGPWADAVHQDSPGLIDRLVRVQSPRPGIHVYYRCSDFGGSQKLACAPATDPCGQVLLDEQGRPRKATLIELKGEGGYCVVPPSPRACHPSYQLYRLAPGSPDLTQVPTLTPEERNILLQAARSLNRWAEEPRRSGRVRVQGQGDSGRPGDDFNDRAQWIDILVPHGWVLVGRRGEVEDWRRPGKDTGLSATVNYGDSGLLYVFSSNAHPFEDGKGYTKFAAFALLAHGGDFAQAARRLADEGYGHGRPGLPVGRRGRTAKFGGRISGYSIG